MSRIKKDKNGVPAKPRSLLTKTDLGSNTKQTQKHQYLICGKIEKNIRQALGEGGTL